MFEEFFMNVLIIIVVIVLLWIFVLPGFALIRDDQVGILTRKMFGSPLPPGHIIATKGEVGIQSQTLMPGLYWRFPIIWRIQKVGVIEISAGAIGIVEAVDGKPIPRGRILGDVAECNNFQDATAFLDGGGYKGPQVGILNPGQYRINTEVFKISVAKATSISSGTVGIVIAADGLPLPSNRVIAPASTGDHKYFSDGQAFLNGNGYRGPQLATLQPGIYYINPRLFTIDSVPVAIVPPGYVAVLVSSVGEEAEQSEPAPNVSLSPNLKQPLNEPGEVVLITDRTKRGILRDPVLPGTYNLNGVAYRVELVPTSAITVRWATEDVKTDTKVKGVDTTGITQKAAEFYNYSQLKCVSNDGFELKVDVKLIIRIPQENAPYVIKRFGTVYNLIEQVVHPLIDSTFRNEAGKEGAMTFLQKRQELQEIALKRAREEFVKYHTEVQGLLIAYIDVDKELLATQTNKQIALQQQTQYAEQARAQEARIDVQKKTATADQQPDVIRSELGITIAKNKADAAIKEAEGVKQSTILRADGDQYAVEAVGKGQAAAYTAQKEALGPEAIAALQMLQKIADGKITITPQILVNGADGANSGGPLLTPAIAKYLLDAFGKPIVKASITAK